MVGPIYDHSSFSSQSSDKSEPQQFTAKRSPSFDREISGGDIYKYASKPKINTQTYRYKKILATRSRSDKNILE